MLKLNANREVSGQVVWREGANVGIKFLPNITEDLVRLLTSEGVTDFELESEVRYQFGCYLP